MALDGILLHKIKAELTPHLPLKINKINEVSKTEILLHCRGKQAILISCHSEYNRLVLTKRSYPTPEIPSNFVMLLRKHIEGSTLVEIEQLQLDRFCIFHLVSRNDLGDRVQYKLVIELMGKYANCILVDGTGRILDALKRIPPFENTLRTIQPGAMFKLPQPQDKQNPFVSQMADPSFSLTQQFQGFSPLLSKEVEYRLTNGQDFISIMKEIHDSTSLFIYHHNHQVLFHCLELTHLKSEAHKLDLMVGLDVVYAHLEEKERVKQLSGDIYRFVKKELKHQRQKLPKLLDSYDEAKDCDKWRQYGELLYAYNIQNTKGQTCIELESFEDGSLVKIPLDAKLDGKQNAKKCFQKYNKGKSGQVYIQEQIHLCEKEITYFEAIEQQLELADFDVAKEIQKELVSGGYLKSKHSKIRKKKKEEPLHITRLPFKDELMITFGKNNLQNDAVTFKEANKNDTWFHAKDFHGSHVTVNTSAPDEETIRFCANLAAYYSKARYSGSVAVNYCLVRNLKKVPGKQPGFVTLTTYQTIYIDPDRSQIEAWLNQ